MIRKMHAGMFILLFSTFSIFSALNLNTIGVSAVEQPAIYIIPAWERTGDPTSAIGTTYNVSVYTNCTNDDILGYEFTLTFNSSVLQGVEVVNGDLITEDVGYIMWIPGTFDNTAGTLSLTGNEFFDPSTLASGPGILANVTFTIVGYGKSDITLGVGTRLSGYDTILEMRYNIIEPPPPYDHLANGVFYNTIPGDVNRDRTVNILDAGGISAHWYPGPPIGPLGYDLDFDINGDGSIDIIDLGIVSANWGQSW